jgi:hypothetical protein
MFETEFEKPNYQQREPARITRKDYAIYLLLVLVGCIGGTFLFMNFSNHFAIVASRERAVVGIVTDQSDSGKGAQTFYKFAVDGTVYHGHSRKDPSLKVGQSLTVYFDHDDPTTNSPLECHKNSEENHRVMILCIYLSAGMAIALMVFLAIARSAKKPEDESSLIQ